MIGGFVGAASDMASDYIAGGRAGGNDRSEHALSADVLFTRDVDENDSFEEKVAFEPIVGSRSAPNA